MSEQKSAFDRLCELSSGFDIKKFGEKTSQQDVYGHPDQQSDKTLLRELIKSGRVYRCRIGLGKVFWGETAEQAMEAALASLSPKQETSDE
jgi:hypothetical protein